MNHVPAQGGSPRQLTTNGSADTYPLMSPSGRYIYFLSNRGGRWAIWSLRVQQDHPAALAPHCRSSRVCLSTSPCTRGSPPTT